MIVHFTSSIFCGIKQRDNRGMGLTAITSWIYQRNLKKTLLAKYKELSRVVNGWTKDELGHVLATADRATHIKHAVHKLNLIRKVLNHEWKTNI